MPGKKFLLFLLLAVAAAAVLTYQVRKGPIELLAPVNRALYFISGGLHGAYRSAAGFISDISANASEVKRLKKRLSQMKVRYEKARAGALEAAGLRALLGLKEHNPDYVATANIVARGADRWANTIAIDAGRSEGIRKNMIAIAPDGLVGKVVRVEPGYSLVLLITDARFAASIRLQPDDQEAIMAGTGDGCVLRYVTSDVKVTKGEEIVTSGLDGIFPDGIRAGKVSSVAEEGGFFQKISVAPSVNTSAIEEVTIVKRDESLSKIPNMGLTNETGP